MTANEVRESFKKFFEGKGHKIVPSAPMVIKDDPTLMFTNAGMNQWKDIILGTKDPGKDVRRVDTQKCLRVSGKHNDLEEWVTILTTTPCSRCSVTGASATTSRRVPSIWHGSILLKF